MSDQNLCELKPSIVSCPKCGSQMTNKWLMFKSNGKPKNIPKLMDCFCKCGYTVGGVKVPKIFVRTRL